MCLLGLAFRQFGDFPVLVLANREEAYARPTAVPQLFAREGHIPAWIGGLDLLAGGTWLGINELGVLVAVTNRSKKVAPENPPSRGILCRRLLAQFGTAGVVDAAMRELEGNRYAGCNLLVADRETAYVIEAGDRLQASRLEPGLHLITNADLDDPGDARIARVRGELTNSSAHDAASWLQSAERICRLTGADGEAPICLVGPDRGTVSSTVVGLGRDLLDSHYWYAPGSPNTTRHEDFTPLFRQLLAGWADLGAAAGSETPGQAKALENRILPDIAPPENSPARRAARQSTGTSRAELQFPESETEVPYRILLRGPWQVEFLARADRNSDGSISWSDRNLPEAETVRLPAAWQTLFGPFRGRIRFRRKFHPPSNIAADDRLSILFSAVGGCGTISLNGESLGNIEPGVAPTRVDVTGQLQVNNELIVDLEFLDFVADAPPGGLFTPVALEIDGSSPA